MKGNEISKELLPAVKAIKNAILQSQYSAAKVVNRVQLSLYFGIGRYISEHSRRGYWGTGAIAAISEQLQKELPGLRGFGSSSLKNMRQFYEEWASVLFRQPSAGDLAAKAINPSKPEASNGNSNRQPLAGDLAVIDFSVLAQMATGHETGSLDLNEFLSISFTHHMEILSKTNTLEERLFYIHHTFAGKWDKYMLRELLKADLYHHQGSMPNNFARAITEPKSALQAIEMFKDEYLLDFINVEEIGERDRADIDEREVEQAIVHNVKNFIMTFGHDFTFVGNQYHLEKFGHELYPDLLFYNRELAALVAVELKRGEFKPAYLGQLSAYLRVLDENVKKPFENPSIGIVLCKSADKSFVEFLIQGYDNPMGVATYKTPEQVRKVLPSEEELRRVMDE